MGQKVSSSPRVRTSYGSPITHPQVVHDPSLAGPGLHSLGESSSNTNPVSSIHHLAMGSGTSNGHQANQRASYHASTSSYAATSSVSTSQQHSRNRARSLGSAQNGDTNNSSGMTIPGLMDLTLGTESDDSSPEDNGLSLPVVTRSRGRTFPFHAQSLPAHLFTTPVLLQQG